VGGIKEMMEWVNSAFVNATMYPQHNNKKKKMNV
jgi:hypothetical protein